MIYRPVRERDEDDIIDYTRRTLASTGFEEISFLSLSVSDYSSLSNLMRKEKQALQGTQVNISFPSMRLDSFSEEIAEFASSVRKSGFTFAPEAGSQRLRRVINKNISDEDLIKAVSIALDNGWKTLKFYFMIGLPTETKEDIHSIANLVKRVVLLSRKYGNIRFHVSVSPFSPKSHTPFQWEKQDTKEEILAKAGILQDAFRSMKQVKFTWRDPKVSEIECILGRGDRTIAKVIYTAWQNGAKFDGWSDVFRYELWQNALNENGINRDDYTGPLKTDEPLPWDHIDKGVTRSFLSSERADAYAEKYTPDCKDSLCVGCGIQRKNAFREYASCYLEKQEPTAATAEPNIKETARVKKNPVQADTAAVKYRLHFIKKNYARYLSHLDILRVLERAFRRADISVVYSTGFNPRPKFSFGPALSLGHASEAEYFDMELLNDTPSEELLSVNRFLPQGLKILAIKKITAGTPALTKSINMFDYRVTLNGTTINPDNIRKVMDQKSLPVKRIRKGAAHRIDIRPMVDTIRTDNRYLHIRTNIIDGRTARIDEITGLLLGNNPDNFKHLPILRQKQLIKEATGLRTPMDY
jgi:radical SAM-linked protein